MLFYLFLYIMVKTTCRIRGKKLLLKTSGKIFVRYAISVLMCFFIALSCTLVFTFVFSHETGYDVFITNEETGETSFLYHHNNSDGEDELFEKYEAQYPSIKKSKSVELSKGYENLSHVLSMLISLVFVTGTMYSSVWEMGNKDINRVNIGLKSENKLFGLCAGSIAALPSFALYVTLWLSHLKILSPEFLSVFRMFNSHFYGFITLVYGGALNSAELSLFKLLVLSVTVWFLPAVCGIAYRIGYSDIRLSEKLVYVKKK